MKIRIILILMGGLLSANSPAIVEIGQEVPDMCWSTVDAKVFCLSDAANDVRVLLYSTGWCPACNEEMTKLVPRVKEFEGRPVLFVSLSAQGDSPGAPPEQVFLMNWKLRHKIPFQVAASPGDAGKSFFNPPYYIPNVVIVDSKGVLALKGSDVTIDAVFEKIRLLLN